MLIQQLMLNFAGDNKSEMTMITKEKAIERLKSSIQRKKEWEQNFEKRFADVDDLYSKLQQA